MQYLLALYLDESGWGRMTPSSSNRAPQPTPLTPMRYNPPAC